MRSDFSRTSLGILAWALLSAWATARTLEFKITQVTEADIAVAPDGKQLVFTILGHLFMVPVEGGTAEQLTFGACYDNDPAFSPDGRGIAFVSDRDGSGGNVFLLEPATSKLTQVTHESQAGQPTWTIDGKAILYLRFLPREEDPRPASIMRGPALCDLRRISLGSDARPETLRGPGLLRSVFFLSDDQPAWTVVEQEAAGGGFFPRSTTHIETITPKDGKVVRLRTLPGDLGRVAVSPKGDGLYCRSPELRFLPLNDDAAKRDSPLPGRGSATRFAVAADGKAAYLSGRGQLEKVALGSGEREVLKFSAQVKLEVADTVRPKWAPPDVGAAVHPRAVLGPELSPNGQSLTFMAAGYMWQQSLDGRPARRLIGDDAWEREPALSPDGRQLAFVRSHLGKREVHILDLESGHTRTLVDLGNDAWARFPSWSGDGKRLVFQKSEGLQSPFGLFSVNVNDGKLEKLASAAVGWSSRPRFAVEGDALYFTSRTGGPGALYHLPLNDKAKPEAITQLARHVNDARVSPNGKWLAFRRNTEIYMAPLSPNPTKEESVRRLSPNGGATFAFTPDSSAVIYSVGSRVWRHQLSGGERQEVLVRLDWRCPTPPPVLLRRVRVLDFAAGQFSPEASLLVERGAIRWIGSESGRELPEGAIVLDAAGRYAIPGLFDFHVHSAWANHEANPDTFLAYGITSVRDTGGGLEMLGALADRGDTSGDPVPRYFYSGEIFEGGAADLGRCLFADLFRRGRA
jgi:Tol biopolymer transport system component